MWGRCFVVAAVLSGCTGPLCTTDYGMQYMGLAPNGGIPDSFSCSRLNTIESRMVGFGLGDPSVLKGYRVWQHPERAWTDPWGRRVGGYTTCFTKEMHIGTGETVFAHELGHALQGCHAELPVDPGSDVDHSDWVRKGFYTYIYEASL